MKSPDLPFNEIDRLKSLLAYDILDSEEQEDFDSITKLASEICETPISLVSFIDKERQWFKSSVGLEIKETPREYSYCAHAINYPTEVFEVKDASLDERFIGNPLLENDPYVRFYAGAPLVTKEGYALGTLCVIDNQPNFLTDKQKSCLKLLADQVLLRIDNRKKNKERELYYYTYKSLDFGYAWFNEAGLLVNHNDRFHELMKIKDSILGKTGLNDVVNRMHYGDFKPLLNGEALKKVEKFVSKVNEKEYTFELEYKPLLVDKNSYLHLVVKDVSHEAKTTIQPLENQEDKLRALDVLQQLQKIASIGYWELDLLNNKLFWSEVTKEIHEVEMGYQPLTELGLDFCKGKYRKIISKVIKEAIETGGTWNETIQIISAKGNRKWVKSAGKCVVENGRSTKVFGLLTDMSDDLIAKEKVLKSKERLKLLANNTNDMVGLHKLDGRFIYVSPACKSILGYDPSELIGKDPYAYFHPDDIINIRDSGHAPLLEKDDEIKIEYRMRHKLGHYVWLETLSKPIMKGGEKESIITSSRDISERIAIQESLAKNYKELEKAKNKAEEAAQAKKLFLATMSHEIRTPLNAINGLAHILLMDEPKESQLDNLKLLQFSGDNLLSLINDILDISKIDTGKLNLNKEVFDLSYLLKNIHQSLNVKAKENKVRLQLKMDKKLPVVFCGDKNRISQIIYNLVGNALKFTNDGEVTIYTEALGKTKLAHKFRVGVKDTGIGISKKNQEKIFSAFEQADSDISRRYGGTGLGLYISCKLLKLMGSKIELESIENIGSHFYFDLQLPTGTLNVNPIESVNLEELKSKNIKVLIVEDNLANQTIIQKFMQLYHLDYGLANNGEEALQKLMDKSYNLVLMDLHMPVMDGFMATKQIRNEKEEYFKKLPIIALTADAFQDVKNKTASTGMDDYLSKPFRPTELVEIIQRYYKAVEALKSKPSGEEVITDIVEPVHSAAMEASSELEQEINTLSEGDLSFKIEFSARFIIGLKAFQEDLFYVIEHNDLKKLNNSFHKLKSTLLVLHLEDLKNKIASLIDSWENERKKKALIANVNKLLGSLLDELNTIIKK